MSKTINAEASVFDQLKAGLEGSIAFSKGQLSLATTALPTPPPKLKSKDIIEVRKGLDMSQAYFAAVLNVSPKTVQSWEQGIREPGDSSLRLLQVVERNPEVVREIVRDSHTGRRQTGSKVIAKSRGKKSRQLL